jgi:hypothetical protein
MTFTAFAALFQMKPKLIGHLCRQVSTYAQREKLS